MKIIDGPTNGTHYILPQFRGRLEKKVSRLEKRASKLGQFVDFSVSFLGPAVCEIRDEFSGPKRQVVREAVIVTGEAPSVGGYKLVAKLCHTDAGTLVLKAPGWEGSITPQMRDSRTCDHCRTNRARKETYLVENANNGSRIRVGSTCLVDYCEADAEVALAIWTMLEEISISENESESEGSCEIYTPIVKFVAAALASVTRHGWAKTGSDNPTRNVASTACSVRPRYGSPWLAEWLETQPSEADTREAEEALDWIQNDGDGVPTGDYGHNLKVACTSPVIIRQKKTNTAGIVASLAFAWRRHNDDHLYKEREEIVSLHFGCEGGRYFREIQITNIREISGEYGLTTIYSMKDCETGAQLTWFASSSLCHAPSADQQYGGDEVEIGQKLTLSFTIKRHDSYKGTKQTQITRSSTKVPKWFRWDIGQIYTSKKALVEALAAA